jgi:hypothetical protein
MNSEVTQMASPARRGRVASLTARVFGALLAGTVTTSAEEPFPEIRPPREPACATSGCPQVSAPLVDDRRVSTIPGVRRPDYGRPKVIVINPPNVRDSFKARQRFNIPSPVVK